MKVNWKVSKYGECRVMVYKLPHCSVYLDVTKYLCDDYNYKDYGCDDFSVTDYSTAHEEYRAEIYSNNTEGFWNESREKFITIESAQKWCIETFNRKLKEFQKQVAEKEILELEA